ncbi:MAG: hypothetical protein A3H29_15800 [Acidobacteria bacterium RIFCSPLOWO2_02_FULL_67_21]|nr:MAG: hypothetical protein A3H29_15800 [Acidobacteria bacterium RIFCSPLOWO2_02_FULL_67_21]
MASLAKVLAGLSAVAFLVAVATNFMGGFLTSSEGWSRAATNLALLALALVFSFRSPTATS